MSRVSVPKYKIDRRFKVNLWGRTKSPFNVRPTRPGQHGKSFRQRLSAFGMQLAEKQKLQFYYGMKERQFRIFFKRSSRHANVAEAFIAMLESRLDAFVYRMKWAMTIFGAKQLIKHKHIMVNGKVVSISSYILKPNDVVTLKEKMKNHALVDGSLAMPDREVPAYFAISDNGKAATFLKRPVIEEVPYPIKIQTQLIVEYYSRRL